MLYILAFLAATWTDGFQVSQKPVVDSPIVGDFYNVPTTLEGLVERADAVIVARIQRATDVSQGKRARTDYGIQLVTVIKEHTHLSAEAIVCRPIGRLELPDRVVRQYQPNLPNFEPGREYLLFLLWDDDKGCFGPAFGPPGAAIIDGAGVRPFVNHPALSELRGMKAPELTKRLLQARVSRR